VTLDISKVAQRLGHRIDQALRSVELSVVIMGPALPDPHDQEQRKKPDSVLRQHLLTRCSELGASVAPEHPVMLEQAKRLGSNSDLCTFEAHLARECDLVVIIPSSPGSLCELGYFGMIAQICTKMVVLCNRDHPRSGTYISEGPLRAASDRRAVLEYTDYSDLDACWNIVERHILALRAQRTLS